MMNQYTALEGERRFKHIDWGTAALPPCQVHLIVGAHAECDRPGEFDCPTPEGPWADLCDRHAGQFSRPNNSAGYRRIRVRNTDDQT